jgi:hypothetical protein
MAKASLPTPSVALINYPSPQISDRLLVERYDHSLSHFGPRNLFTAIPAYGVEHPDTRKFPGFRLAYVKLVIADDWYDWYWVNDRQNQDAYNYAIDYPYGDKDYPRYTRTYLIRRSEYAPLAFGTPDPVESSLVLVAESTPRFADETLNTLYVMVVRTYERRPSPWIVNYQADPETRAPIKQMHRFVYAPDTAKVLVSTTATAATAGGITTLTTAATLPDTIVGSLVYLSGGPLSAPILRQIVSRPTTNTVTVDETVTSGSSITFKTGGAPLQVPYITRDYDGTDAFQAVERLEIINSGNALSTRIEYGWAEYAFPTLVFGYTDTSITARDGSAILRLQGNRRAGFSQLVRTRTVISYGPIGSLSAPAIFSPVLNDLQYQGIAVGPIADRNVLNNTIQLKYTSGTDNPKWPFFEEQVDFSASDLSADEYMDIVNGVVVSGTGYVNGELIIGSPVKPWRYGLERMEVTYIKAR